MSPATFQQSGEAHPWTSFWWSDDRSSELVWRSDDRSSELVWRSDDRSSETVWRSDDRSYDRHFVPMITHRTQFFQMIALLTGIFFR